MSKLAILISGDQVIATHTVPDDTHIIWHSLHTEVVPKPSPTPTLQEMLDAPPAAAEPRRLPEPGSREGYSYTQAELDLVKSSRTDAQVARLTGRSSRAIRTYRRKMGQYMRKPQMLWTPEEEKDLLDLAGSRTLGSTSEYAPLVEYFPRHPNAGALRTKHQRLLGIK